MDVSRFGGRLGKSSLFRPELSVSRVDPRIGSGWIGSADGPYLVDRVWSGHDCSGSDWVGSSFGVSDQLGSRFNAKI